MDGRRRGLYEDRDGLWGRDGERSGLRRRHRNVGCGRARRLMAGFAHDFARVAGGRMS